MNFIKTITAAELAQKLDNKEPLHLIDVREHEEVATGMIPTAQHIPMGEIPVTLHKLDKQTPYIFICRSGNRSGQVCLFLQEQGYDVTNMVGGMLEWTGEIVF
ncbi:rhodanese-like domain-containing protein [Bacillus chungangensis]|uniref:Rhodanese-related sulfurtransferase n=1 Tax=Bacillus chungangensis TaxID=587633 RepID=A0ABT9WUD5_9BACI|nr:rhodanese-like domain-containing protein [Bacillus chungangensis]MDQ0176902.1 rhodanese-related sulfurtransferase [Bacillus chungangensis]